MLHGAAISGSQTLQNRTLKEPLVNPDIPRVHDRPARHTQHHRHNRARAMPRVHEITGQLSAGVTGVFDRERLLEAMRPQQANRAKAAMRKQSSRYVGTMYEPTSPPCRETTEVVGVAVRKDEDASAARRKEINEHTGVRQRHQQEAAPQQDLQRRNRSAAPQQAAGESNNEEPCAKECKAPMANRALGSSAKSPPHRGWCSIMT